jgi:S1-C subfamily serine protease
MNHPRRLAELLRHNTPAKQFLLPTLIFLALASLPRPTTGQDLSQWLQRPHNPSIAARDNGAMMRLVRPLSESVENSVIQVFCGTRVVSLGTVVSEDGYVLTKHSELTSDPISVRLPNGEKARARLSSVRRRNDLALLKIEGLENTETQSEWKIQPAKLSMVTPPTGSFVISPGRDGYTIGFGVLGVQARRIDHQGKLGVNFYNAPDGPARVRRVAPQSGAFEAGLQGGDEILKINGEDTYGVQAAINKLGSMYPGEVVRLTIQRGEDTIEIDAVMSDAAMIAETENDARVNGPRNLRLSGFDQVIQHDTVLTPNQCGGPLLDTSGNIIGINIARAGRVVSYALPSSLVVAEMISMLEEARR